MVVGNCSVLSNSYQETRFRTVENFNYTIDSLDWKRQKLYWKTTERWYHITWNQSTFSKKPVFFQTPWQIVALVPQNVLHFCIIALCMPKCDLEAIKHFYYITVNPKFVWKCRGLDISSQKCYSTPSAPNRHASKMCKKTANTKTIMENNWPLAWFLKKPNLKNAKLWQNPKREDVCF